MNTNCQDKNEIVSNDNAEMIENDEASPKFLSTAIGGYYKPVFRQFLKEKPPTKHSKHNPNVTWTPGDIPIVSKEFFRSRTVVEVTSCNGSTIASRIFASNRTRSVHAVYDGAIAHCKTSSHMKFTIRIMHKFKNSKTILLDVRRKTGCSIEFRGEYQAIVCAAVYGELIPIDIPRIQDMEFMQGNYIPLKEGIIRHSLDVSIVHLASKMYDVRVIALQTLLSMTNTASKETSSKVCKLILETHHPIFEYILRDVMKRVDDSDSCNDDSEEYLRSLTLNILGSVLSSEHNNQNLVLFVQQNPWTTSVIDSLVWYIDMARTSPWNACLAAKCLRFLIPTFHREIHQTIVTVTLKNAEEFGNTSHKLLKVETQAALVVMNA